MKKWRCVVIYFDRREGNSCMVGGSANRATSRHDMHMQAPTMVAEAIFAMLNAGLPE